MAGVEALRLDGPSLGEAEARPALGQGCGGGGLGSLACPEALRVAVHEAVRSCATPGSLSQGTDFLPGRANAEVARLGSVGRHEGPEQVRGQTKNREGHVGGGEIGNGNGIESLGTQGEAGTTFLVHAKGNVKAARPELDVHGPLRIPGIHQASHRRYHALCGQEDGAPAKGHASTVDPGPERSGEQHGVHVGPGRTGATPVETGGNAGREAKGKGRPFLRFIHGASESGRDPAPFGLGGHIRAVDPIREFCVDVAGGGVRLFMGRVVGHVAAYAE